MLILHEGLSEEATLLANTLMRELDIFCETQLMDFSEFFFPIQQFEGYNYSIDMFKQKLGKDKAKLILTGKDIYYKTISKDDDWIFAENNENITVISTARLKRYDDEPSCNIEVPKGIYFKRLSHIVLHEIGHDIIKGKHMRDAVWVNAQTGYQINLEEHCPDNRCIMYQVAGINTPLPEEGHMLVGGEKRYDTGLDELIARAYANKFCENCRISTVIDGKYAL